jgi:flagellar protein FliO/FliZ
MRRRLSAILLALVSLALFAPAALAVSDKDLKSGLADTSASGSGVPHVSMSVGSGLGRTVLGLVIVVGVILIVAKLLKANQKRRQGIHGGNGDLVEVIGTTPIGPNRNLHLVRIGDEVLLLGAGEGGITPLRSFHPHEAVAIGAIEAPQPSFAAALEMAGGPAPLQASASPLALPAPSAPKKSRSMLGTLRELSAR